MYGYTPESLARVARLNQDTRLIRVASPLEADAFIVHRVHGTEALSRPFQFSVDLLSPDAQLELKQLVGHPMRLSLHTPDGDRHFHGYVQEFARIGTDGDLATYRAELAPWFAFLDHSSDCRIFQDRTVVEIVEEVFAPYAELAACRYDLDAARYSKLPYCVQYNESDFAFVSRLLEDEGIHYRFDHAADGHTMVLSDDSTRAPAIDGRVRVSYHADDGVRNEHGLDSWISRRRIGSNAQAVKSFDFKQPKSALMVDLPLSIPHGRLPRLETYRYDGAARFADCRVGDALALLRAEEAAWPTKRFEATGDHRGLQAGRHFVLHGHFEHLETDEEARQFLVVETVHDIRNNFSDGYTEAEGATYRCAATCLRHKIPFRPQRLTPMPRMAGPQTATVVGPPGEEIHADRYGRVKVQFHWDRLGRFDDASSCWVRVASPWAGAGMGGVSAPRVGQEVVVDFLDGNPDRPLITGRVYNEDNLPPFGLEVSGIKSRTVKGEGYNEVSMHDGAGQQLLNLHAQKDMATTVLNDQNATVNNNKTTSVASNHTMSVGANQAISVGGTRGISVTGDDSLSVTGGRTTDVKGTATTTVKGAVTETFETGQTLSIPAVGYSETITGKFDSALTGPFKSLRDGPWDETITGPASWTVNAAVTETVTAGGRTVSITGGDSRSVVGAVEDSNQGERTVSVVGSSSHQVQGPHTSFSTADMTVASSAKVVLAVGGASVVIDAGSITISAGGSTIKVDASGVSVDGATINLNC
ncbi:type VI secretion system Vgr family protein [Cognatilysobacter bugurensis]|uniref:Type IV secretion protein Rhs n=1 Tax=Cognatilysobacter bugurensis TaxID=543356 RepID=A0A918ST98_9GAMM|nr:type VI secretion system tip protein TssI/VgrG [Lysobacter bugurensis]GHA70152.1 type IV secretion protein Rhs [Lysobacter bugurensis]